MALHIDEINIQSRHLFRNQSTHGPSTNDPEKLANSMLVFLMSKLTGSKKSINLCTKPVHNLKAECLHNMLTHCLNKANECNYEIIPIIMDGASVNVKVAKKLLRPLNAEMEGNKVCVAEIKLCTSFIHNGKTYFILFCIVHIIKILEMHYS